MLYTDLKIVSFQFVFVSHLLSCFYSCFFSGFALSVQTEYILTACLVVFFFVLIATVALVIQIALLHKSLKKLKAKSHR